MGIIIMFKDLQGINKVCPRKDVTAHANAKTLSQTRSRRGCNSFIAKRTGFRDNADMARSEARKGLEANATFSNGGDDPGTVCPDKTGFRLGFKHGMDLDWLERVPALR